MVWQDEEPFSFEHEAILLNLSSERFLPCLLFPFSVVLCYWLVDVHRLVFFQDLNANTPIQLVENHYKKFFHCLPGFWSRLLGRNSAWSKNQLLTLTNNFVQIEQTLKDNPLEIAPFEVFEESPKPALSLCRTNTHWSQLHTHLFFVHHSSTTKLI